MHHGYRDKYSPLMEENLNFYNMMNLLSFLSPRKRLERKYKSLLKMSHKYSRIDRKISDQYFQQAYKVLQSIEKLDK